MLVRSGDSCKGISRLRLAWINETVPVNCRLKLPEASGLGGHLNSQQALRRTYSGDCEMDYKGRRWRAEDCSPYHLGCSACYRAINTHDELLTESVRIPAAARRF